MRALGELASAHINPAECGIVWLLPGLACRKATWLRLSIPYARQVVASLIALYA